MVQWSQGRDGRGGEKGMDGLKLKGKIIEKGYNYTKVANELGVARSTLWRKLDQGTFTIGEVETIVSFLNLSDTECIDIFFPNYRSNATEETLCK